MSLADDLHLLTALDSPLVDTLAPELVPLRDRMREIGRRLNPQPGDPQPSCSACEQRRLLQQLVALQVELGDLVDATPALQDLLPQLLATGTPS